MSSFLAFISWLPFDAPAGRPDQSAERFIDRLGVGKHGGDIGRQGDKVGPLSVSLCVDAPPAPTKIILFQHLWFHSVIVADGDCDLVGKGRKPPNAKVQPRHLPAQSTDNAEQNSQVASGAAHCWAAPVEAIKL